MIHYILSFSDERVKVYNIRAEYMDLNSLILGLLFMVSIEPGMCLEGPNRHIFQTVININVNSVKPNRDFTALYGMCAL